MSGYHQLPPTILTSLTGGGDQAERDLLRAGQVSKRLAQLRAILDLAGDLPDAKTAALAESFDVLATIQRHDADVVAELLGGPQVGAWTSWCLRRLTRTGDGTNGTPLWIHLAHLGAVAAAAAVRSGAEVRVRVPVREGTVAIPAVGRARVPEAWALTECTTGPAGLLFNGEPAVDWQPVRAVCAEAGGVVLETQLDEIDPYWRSFGIPISDRLSDDAVGRWRDGIQRAWQVLADRHPHRLGTLAVAIRCLVPVEQGGRLGRVSASSVDAAGAVALTEPTNAVRLAATLIHESQHFRLNALHDLRPLFREQTGALLYSPWRNDARGLPGVVHGAMAFLGVADFWQREPSGPLADFEYARHVRQLRIAIEVAGGAQGAGELTEFGRAVVDTLGGAIAALPAGTRPAEVERLAEDLVSEHRVRWRLENITPAADVVGAAAKAWERGDPLPETTGTAHASAPSGDNPLTRLAMAWLEKRDEVLALTESALTARFPGATTRDLHLLGGDYASARVAALDRVEAGTADERDWATLAVAHAHHCADPSGAPLVTRPELVMAAWHHIRADSPDGLRELLSTYEAGTSTSDSMRR